MSSHQTLLRSTLCGLLCLLGTRAVAAEKKHEILFLDAEPFHKYLTDYCDKGNDCTTGTNGLYTGGDSDCTHFVAHALNAGGVKVPGIEASCDKGLVVRVRELRKWFDDATTRYVNVEQVPSWHDTRAYDVGFIEFFYAVRWKIGFDAVHALVLAEPSKEKSGNYFAHTNARCGLEEISYGKDVAGVHVDRPIVFFRIGPSPLDGAKWADKGDANSSRFVLQFKGREVTLTERGLEAAQNKSQTLKLKLEGGDAGVFVIRRPNDDATLQLLSYTDAGLRQAILARNPEPSTLTIRLADDGTLAVEWRGLRVKKKPNGSLDQIIQPSASSAVNMVFKRS